MASVPRGNAWRHSLLLVRVFLPSPMSPPPGSGENSARFLLSSVLRRYVFSVLCLVPTDWGSSKVVACLTYARTQAFPGWSSYEFHLLLMTTAPVWARARDCRFIDFICSISDRTEQIKLQPGRIGPVSFRRQLSRRLPECAFVSFKIDV